MRGAFEIESFAILLPGEPPDVSFAPPASRRRLSPLQKIFFHLARAAGSPPGPWIVFASRDGEDSLTRRLTEDYNLDGSVSPHRFSASVYNAAPGLWSVFTGNRAPYTALAAGAGSIEAGILESLASGKDSLFVYAEETGGGFGAAARFRPAAPDASGAFLAREGDASAPFVTFDSFAAFLEGRIPALRGRHLTLERTGRGRI